VTGIVAIVVGVVILVSSELLLAIPWHVAVLVATLFYFLTHATGRAIIQRR
jgi:membrane-bound ClpP family serine protease